MSFTVFQFHSAFRHHARGFPLRDLLTSDLPRTDLASPLLPALPGEFLSGTGSGAAPAQPARPNLPTTAGTAQARARQGCGAG